MAVVDAVVAGCACATVVASDHGLAPPLDGFPWSTAALSIALPVLTATHYTLGAMALRATSGRRLPLLDTIRAQLSAAVANRLVPNGVGGCALNVRYLQRSGSAGGAAVSTLFTLSVIGGLADAGNAAAVSTLGPVVGIHGASEEFRRLAHNAASGGGRSPWIGVTAAAVVAVLLLRRYGEPRHAAIVRGVRQGARHALRLTTDSRRLIAATAASAGTTAALGVGFVLTAQAIGVTSKPPPLGALFAIYVVSAAVGGSTPLPPVCGATEAALAAALVFTGYTAPSSAVVVVVFRLATYWLPVPFGVVAARRLRARGLL